MVRFACRRIAGVCLASALVCTVASAQEQPLPSLREAAQSQVVATPLAVGIKAAGPALAAPPRPAVLLPLYASFATLQGLDAHSTWRALNQGAVEANPVMKGFAGNPTALLAVKAAGTAINNENSIWFGKICCTAYVV